MLFGTVAQAKLPHWDSKVYLILKGLPRDLIEIVFYFAAAYLKLVFRRQVG